MQFIENRMYIFQIENIEVSQDETEIKTTLSKSFICWDKAHAISWENFTSEHILKGLLRELHTDPIRDNILQTSRDLGDVFCFYHRRIAVVWTGKWTALERIGFLTATFAPQALMPLYAKIDAWIQEKGLLKSKQ